MSPQNSTLGLMGGDFQYSTIRSGFKSGMYRPEDNAYIRNYAEMVDNFFYTGNVFTYPNTTNNPNYLSGIFVDPSLTRLFSCGGYTVDNSLVASTDNSVYLNLFSQEGRISSLGTSSNRALPWITGTFNNTISWYPNQSGLSFKPDGTKLIMSGYLVSTSTFSTVDRGPIIMQYSLSTPWDIQTITGSSTWNYAGTNYPIYTTSSQFWYAPEKSYNFGVTADKTKIQDIFVHSDGLVFYYLRNNILYQGSISSAWDIGTNGANLNVNTASLTIDPNLVSSSALTSYFSGFTFNATGTKLYLISSTEYSVSSQSRSGATIFQYNLSTPWSISTASFKTFLTVSGFDAEMAGKAQGLLMLPDGETMICASLQSFTGRLYEYKVLPY